MVRIAATSLAVGILALLLASAGRASLHHPTDQRASIPVDADGVPEPLPFEQGFKLRRVVIRNMGVPEWKGPEPSERRELEARIKKAQEKPPARRTPEENLALAIDLIHYGKFDEAEGILRGQRGFLANITLAHIAILRGDWLQADDYLDIANSGPQPTSVTGTSPQKLAWQLKLNKGPLRKLVKLRLAEAAKKPPLEDELPDNLFGVNFVNEAGQYEPGNLAPSEKAKLPGGGFTEAIATVQQLVLWFPFDVRLYWLLGELYAAKGEFKVAQDIMDECVNSGRYSNRKVLMQHREAVAKAVANMPPPATDDTPDTPPAVPFTFGAVWWYFGAVALFALLALVRAILRWRNPRAESPGSI